MTGFTITNVMSVNIVFNTVELPNFVSCFISVQVLIWLLVSTIVSDNF